ECCAPGDVPAAPHRMRTDLGNFFDLGQRRDIRAAQQLKGDWLDQREAAQQLGVETRDMQSERTAVGMPDQMYRFIDTVEQRKDDLRLALEVKRPGSRPVRRAAIAVQVGRDHAVALAQAFRKRSPLSAGATGAVQQKDRFAGAQLDVFDLAAEDLQSRHRWTLAVTFRPCSCSAMPRTGASGGSSAA